MSVTLILRGNYCFYIPGPPCGMALTFVPFLGKNISTDIFAVGSRYRTYLCSSSRYVISIIISFTLRSSSTLLLMPTDVGLSPQNNPVFHNFWRTPYARFTGGSTCSGQSLWNPPTSCTRPPGIRTTFRQLFLYSISRKRWVVSYRQVCAEIPLCKYFYLATEKSSHRHWRLQRCSYRPFTKIQWKTENSYSCSIDICLSQRNLVQIPQKLKHVC